MTDEVFNSMEGWRKWQNPEVILSEIGLGEGEAHFSTNQLFMKSAAFSGSL
jgi:hypothetical protein